jgi:hypothetical protein
VRDGELVKDAGHGLGGSETLGVDLYVEVVQRGSFEVESGLVPGGQAVADVAG